MRFVGSLALSFMLYGMGFGSEHPDALSGNVSTDINVEDFTPVTLNDESHLTTHSPHAEHESHFHHNHLALFLGVTVHEMHLYPSLGLDYEFLFNKKIGITAVVEQVLAEHTEQITGLGIAVHPSSCWKIAAIPALVVAEGHAAFLMRGTVEFGLHAGPVSYGPSVSVDYAHATVLVVMGVVVGMGF